MKMKKLVIICMLFVGFTITAQEHDMKKEDRKEMHERAKDLTPQQIASLQTKKMTLHLDLNEKQQKEVETLNLEIATKRKAMAANRKDKKELSNDEKVAMREQMLDDKIATKKKLKSILTEAQFSKWENENAMKKRGMAKHKMNKKGNR
jgi:predicted HTH transcriptional regulator